MSKSQLVLTVHWPATDISSLTFHILLANNSAPGTESLRPYLHSFDGQITK